jgi:DNA polymerase V
MLLNGCQEMMRRGVIANKVGVSVGYSFGEIDSTGKTVSMSVATNLYSLIKDYALKVYNDTTDKSMGIRKLSVVFSGICDKTCEGYDLFTDFEKVEKEKERELAVLQVYDKYGKNAVLRGTNLLDEATQRERNTFIGGHRAGFYDQTTKS